MIHDKDAIIAEARHLLDGHLLELSVHCGIPRATLANDAPVLRQLAVLVDVANGKHEMCADDDDNAFADTVSVYQDNVLQALYNSAASGMPVAVEDLTLIGRVLLAVTLWLDCDELITLRDAAMIARGSAEDRDLVWINDQIKRGRLERYTDPDEPNPQRAGRVRRMEVERLRDAKV